MSGSKVKAHNSVRLALKSGVLVKSPCAICGSASVDAHHEDYSKPLEVIWYCRRHHIQLHRGGVKIDGEHLLARVRSYLKTSNYMLSKRLRLEFGVNITEPGLAYYDKSKSRSIRSDVLAALFTLCSKAGISEKEFMGWSGP